MLHDAIIGKGLVMTFGFVGPKEYFEINQKFIGEFVKTYIGSVKLGVQEFVNILLGREIIFQGPPSQKNFLLFIMVFHQHA